MKARVLAALALALLAAAVALALALRERRALAERVILHALRQRNVEIVSLSVERVGLRELELRELRLGADDALRIDAARLRYSFSGLRRGHLDALLLSGPTLRAALADGALSFGSLDALRGQAPARDAGAPAQAPALPPTPTLPLTQLSVEGARLLLAAGGSPLLELDGLAAEATVDPGPLPRGSARIEAIRYAPRRLPELALEANFAPEEDGLGFAAAVRERAGRATLHAAGRHDLARGAGQAELRLEPVPLAREGSQLLRESFPELAEGVALSAGTLEGRGEIRWGEGPPRGHFDLALRDARVDTGAMRHDGVNLALRVDLWPPRIAPGQILSVARSEAGLELSDGFVEFGVSPDGRIEIASAVWSFAGGRIRTSGSLDLRAEEQPLLLVVEDVDLAELLALVDIAELSGSGRISGRLPVVRRGERFEIHDGELSASPEGGWIRYPVGESARRLVEDFQALENFHYDRLTLRVNGDTLGPVVLQVSLGGANPDFRGGQPYVYNLNLEGRLVDLVRKGVAVYSLPDRIRERLAEIAR